MECEKDQRWCTMSSVGSLSPRPNPRGYMCVLIAPLLVCSGLPLHLILFFRGVCVGYALSHGFLNFRSLNLRISGPLNLKPVPPFIVYFSSQYNKTMFKDIRPAVARFPITEFGELNYDQINDT